MPENKDFARREALEEKKGTGEMTVQEAGHLGGEKGGHTGGQKVKHLIEAGEKVEEQEGHRKGRAA
jgi:hypothetical protein